MCFLFSSPTNSQLKVTLYFLSGTLYFEKLPAFPCSFHHNFFSWFPCSSVVPLQLHRVATLQQLAVCKVSTHGFDALAINGETSILASHVSILDLPWRCRRHQFVDNWMALSIVYPTCHSRIIPRYLIPSQETLGHFNTGSVGLAGLRQPYVGFPKEMS